MDRYPYTHRWDSQTIIYGAELWGSVNASKNYSKLSSDAIKTIKTDYNNNVWCICFI